MYSSQSYLSSWKKKLDKDDHRLKKPLLHKYLSWKAMSVLLLDKLKLYLEDRETVAQLQMQYSSVPVYISPGGLPCVTTAHMIPAGLCL